MLIFMRMLLNTLKTLWSKFQNLKTMAKIIVASFAIIFFPLIALAIVLWLLLKNIRIRNRAGIITAAILSLLLATVNVAMFTSEPEEEDTHQIIAEEQQEAKEKEEQEKKKKEEQEQQEKEEAEVREKEEAEAREREKQEKEEAEAREREEQAKEEAEAREKEEQEYNDSITVYCNGGSSTSNKYHSSPTAHGMKGSISMSLDEAEDSGYVPCKRCY